MKIETYSRYSKEDLGIGLSEWEDIKEFLDRIKEPMDRVLNSSGAEGVEEEPPRISPEGKFVTGGWVGSYPAGIVVYPDRLSKEQYNVMLEDLAGWIESLGMDLIEMLLPYLPESLLDYQALLQRYSNYLIEFTELVLSERLPVEIERSSTRGKELVARPNFPKIIQERAQGSKRVVSKKTEFSLESLPNLLLVRFHAEIQDELRRLKEAYQFSNPQLDRQLAYHRSFLTRDLPNRLLNQSLETNFSNPNVIQEARSIARRDFEEIIDHWEAFRQNLTMEIEVTQQFSSTIKPASKVYELWCLTLLVEVVSDLVGFEPEDSSLSSSISWGRKATLFYNRTISTHSNYIGPNFRPLPGKPDFALEVDGALRWVGDAKFKEWDDLDLGDYQRFLSYMIDYLPEDSEGNGSILYVDKVGRKNHRVGEHSLSHLSIHPGSKEKSVQYLTDVIGSWIET